MNDVFLNGDKDEALVFQELEILAKPRLTKRDEKRLKVLKGQIDAAVERQTSKVSRD
jgi:hypothetical protein